MTRLTAAACLLACLAVAAPLAQRGGGGAGGGGGFSGAPQTRLAMLTATFKLTDEQKKTAKSVMDAAYKSAGPLRTALTAARTAVGKAIQANGDQASIDQAIAAYAAKAADMAQAEMQALASVVHGLTPEQQADKAALTTGAYMMRGAFIGKKWDATVDARFY